MTEPTTLHATSLDDIGPLTVPVEVERPDGRVVTVSLRALSSEEVWAARAAVKWPEPPVKDFRKTGDAVQPVYNFQDDGYRKAMDEATRTLALKLLLASLTFEVPGASEDERLDALKNKIGQYALNALAGAVSAINHLSEEAVAARARSFRAARDGGAPGDGAARAAAA